MIVSDLAEQGMSTRAIAPIVGASYDTVQRDIRGDRNLSPDGEPRQVAYDREAGVQSLHTSPDPEAPTFDPTPDSSVKDFTDEHPAPRAVHGRDGITRTFRPRTAPEPVTVDHETGVDGGVRVWVSRNVTPMCYSNGYDDFGPRVRAV